MNHVRKVAVFLMVAVLLFLVLIVGSQFTPFSLSQIIFVNRHIKPALPINEEYWMSKYSYSSNMKEQLGDHTLRLNKDEVAIKLKNGEMVRIKDAEIIIFNFKGKPVLINNNQKATGF